MVGAAELGARIGVNGTVRGNFQGELTLVSLVRAVDDETVKDGVRRVARIEVHGDPRLLDAREAGTQGLNRVRGLREVIPQPLTLGIAGPACAGTGRAGGGASAGIRGTSGRTGGRATRRTRRTRRARGAAVTVVTHERENDECDDETQGQKAEEPHEGVERPSASARRVVIAVVVGDGAAVAGARTTRAIATTSRLVDVDVGDLDVQAGDDVVGVLVGDQATRVVAANRDQSDGRIIRVARARLDGRRGRRIGLLGALGDIVPLVAGRRLGADDFHFGIDLSEQVSTVLFRDQVACCIVLDAKLGHEWVFRVITPVLRGQIDASVVSLVAAGIRPVIVIVIAHVALLGLLRRVHRGIRLGLFRHFCRMFDGDCHDLRLGFANVHFAFAELRQNLKKHCLSCGGRCNSKELGDLGYRLVAEDFVAHKAHRTQHEVGDTLRLDFGFL